MWCRVVVSPNLRSSKCSLSFSHTHSFSFANSWHTQTAPRMLLLSPWGNVRYLHVRLKPLLFLLVNLTTSSIVQDMGSKERLASSSLLLRRIKKSGLRFAYQVLPPDDVNLFVGVFVLLCGPVALREELSVCAAWSEWRRLVQWEVAWSEAEVLTVRLLMRATWPSRRNSPLCWPH